LHTDNRGRSDVVRTLFHGGTVLVLDGVTPPQEALVLEDDRVLAVGELRELDDLAGRGAVRVDLEGAVAMPGVIDTHPHVLHFAAIQAPLVDILDARNHEEILDRIRARAATTPKGEWILTTPVGEPHYFIRRSYLDLDERRLPNRWELDRATTDHPVLIQAWAPRQPNVCAFNSRGLKSVHLSDFIPDRVCDVTLDKDFSGRLTGILRGPVTNYQTYDPFWGQILTKIMMQLGAFDTNFGALPPSVLRNGIAQQNAKGVTGIYECHLMSAEDIGAYQELRRLGELTARVVTCLEPEAGADFYPLEYVEPEVLLERMERGRALQTLDDPLLRINGLSLGPGGPCWSGHWWSHFAYPDPYGRPTYGTRMGSEENERAFVSYCVEHGLRLNMVAGSYREHDEFLTIVEPLAAERGITDSNWVVQHALTITPEQARRYKALGCKVTTSMSFSWGKGDVYGERLGKNVWRDLVPLKRLLDTGLVVGCGTDWGPPNVWEHMQLAQTHEFGASGHRNDGPDQVVTREESIAMWTREAAKILDWPDLGTLEPGTLGDVVVVDRNPLTCELDDLPGTRALVTVVGGRTVHDAGVLRAPESALAV
jgi:predicted amidohydrolase YtcJ